MNIIVWIKSSQKEIFTTHYHKGASYLALLETLTHRGHRAFLAYDAASWHSDDRFTPAAEYRNRTLQPPIKHDGGDNDGSIRADVIYNLGNIPGDAFSHRKGRHTRIVNTPEFKSFCASKITVYEYLKEFFPKTIAITSETAIAEALKRLSGDRIVFKPNTGTNGRGVRILKKDEVKFDDEMRAIIAEPGGALLQEFVDTSHGIPNICDASHDLRLAVINGTIALTHVRTPEPGSLIANYAQGATIHELAINDIPKNIFAFHKKIHARIAAQFPDTIYTADLGINTDGKPILFEINGTIAFPWPEFESKDAFVEKLARYLE